MQDWSVKRFNLPKSSAISGLINFHFTPYSIKILDDLSPQSPVRKVVLICGTQVAKSTIILMAFAYRVDCNIYGDMLYYFPDDGMARKWSKTKLEDTIRANSYLVEAIEKGKKGDDNVEFKKWSSGSLIIKGGKSGSKYRMDTGNFIVADDFADFPMNVGATTSGKEAQKKTGEGSPDKLLEDRGSGTGGTAKIFINSSPKSEKECPAWRTYTLTNQCHYFIKCPKCEHEQAWEFENVKMPHEDYKITEPPWIECQNIECGHRVYEEDKAKLMQAGVWKPTAEGSDDLVNGYRMPSVYSLLGYPLTKMCQDWLDACKIFDETGDEGEKIRHRNSKQARPWKRKVGKTVSHSALFKTMENLDPLPEDCIILSCGFDVQENPGRIEGQVNGFGPNNDRFIIDHQIFGGDPKIKPGLEGSPWNAVSDFLLTKTYPNSFGQNQSIYCAGIDMGWGKEEAWIKYFLQNFEPLFFQKVFGVFGKEVTKGSINFIGKNATVDIDGFESWGLYTNIRRVSLRNLLKRHVDSKQAGSESNFHLGNKPCFTEEFCRQLTIRRPNEKGVMVKPHDHARDEAESCAIYADAAFVLAFRDFEQGPDWEDFKTWNKQKSTTNGGNDVSIIGSVF